MVKQCLDLISWPMKLHKDLFLQETIRAELWTE